MVKETPVLIVEDQQQRLVPLWTGGQRVVDEQHELLPVSDIRWRVVVVWGDPIRLKSLKFGSIHDRAGN